jgi:cellulose 1,4-beta-cellobiosidase
MQVLSGNLPVVAICSALLFAFGCAGGGLEQDAGASGQGGNPSGGGSGGNAGGGQGGGQGGNAGVGAGGAAGGGQAGTGGAGVGGGSGGAAPDGGNPDGLIASGVHIQYKVGDGNTGMVTSVPLNFLVKNEGPIPVDFHTFSMRYWFTLDGAPGLTVHCETVQPGQQISCTDVVTVVKPVDPPRTNADSYVDISITPSATATGIGYMGQISQLTIRFQSNAPGFTQGNDYSFDPTVTSFKDFPKVTAYAGDTLVWGVEP